MMITSMKQSQLWINPSGESIGQYPEGRRKLSTGSQLSQVFKTHFIGVV